MYWFNEVYYAAWSGGSLQQSGSVVRPTQQPADSVVAAARQRQQQQQQRSWDAQHQWDSNSVRADTTLSDQFLSDILDQVIDIVPDAIATGIPLIVIYQNYLITTIGSGLTSRDEVKISGAWAFKEVPIGAFL